MVNPSENVHTNMSEVFEEVENPRGRVSGQGSHAVQVLSLSARRGTWIWRCCRPPSVPKMLQTGGSICLDSS